MANSPENQEQMKQPFLEEPSLLDWYSLTPSPETIVDIHTDNVATAIGLLVIAENLREGYDIKFEGIGIKIPAQTISGIHRRDVQAFRESETYPYTRTDIDHV